MAELASCVLPRITTRNANQNPDLAHVIGKMVPQMNVTRCERNHSMEPKGSD